MAEPEWIENLREIKHLLIDIKVMVYVIVGLVAAIALKQWL